MVATVVKSANVNRRSSISPRSRPTVSSTINQPAGVHEDADRRGVAPLHADRPRPTVSAGELPGTGDGDDHYQVSEVAGLQAGHVDGHAARHEVHGREDADDDGDVGHRGPLDRPGHGGADHEGPEHRVDADGVGRRGAGERDGHDDSLRGDGGDSQESAEQRPREDDDGARKEGALGCDAHVVPRAV